MAQYMGIVATTENSSDPTFSFFGGVLKNTSFWSNRKALLTHYSHTSVMLGPFIPQITNTVANN